MSDTMHYFIHCDHPAICTNYLMCDIGQTPSEMRKSSEMEGWVSRKRPPSPQQAEMGIHPTAYQDFCPAHTKDAE